MKIEYDWLIYGRIVGIALPVTPVRLDNIWVGPPPTDLVLQAHVRAPRPTIGNPNPLSCISESTDTQVHSTAYFWLARRAETAADAFDIAEREDVSRLQAVLSAHAGSLPYRFELLGAERKGLFQGAQSAALKHTFFLPNGLSPASVVQANYDMIHLAKNAKVSAVFRHFSDAIRSRDTASTPQEHESALLSAFKVIEGIASLTTVQTPPETLEAEQQNVIAKLLVKLQSKAAISAKAEAIRESRNALERLEIRFLGLKIPAIAQTYGLSNEWEDAAKRFIEFRNRHLGHAGPLSTAAERDPWTDDKSDTSAYALARALTKAYLDKTRKIDKLPARATPKPSG